MNLTRTHKVYKLKKLSVKTAVLFILHIFLQPPHMLIMFEQLTGHFLTIITSKIYTHFEHVSSKMAYSLAEIPHNYYISIKKKKVHAYHDTSTPDGTNIDADTCKILSHMQTFHTHLP